MTLYCIILYFTKTPEVLPSRMWRTSQARWVWATSARAAAHRRTTSLLKTWTTMTRSYLYTCWVYLWQVISQVYLCQQQQATETNKWNINQLIKRFNRQYQRSHTHTHTHTRLTALCPELPGWDGTRKVKPIWILHITMPAPHHSVFYRTDVLSAVQPTVSKHWRQNINEASNLKITSTSWQIEVLDPIQHKFKNCRHLCVYSVHNCCINTRDLSSSRVGTHTGPHINSSCFVSETTHLLHSRSILCTSNRSEWCPASFSNSCSCC